MKEYIERINSILEKEIKSQVESKNESLIEDKKRMSEYLYETMTELYNMKPFEERKAEHLKEICKDCRYEYDCDKSPIPKDVMKPNKSDCDWIPSKKVCSEFNWD